MKYFIIYMSVINVITFAVFGIDKLKAVKEKWRVPEKVLFLLALLGGSLGALIGMYSFRHKTKKIAFKIGIPVIMIAQIIFIYFMNR
ncbi:MAG: DUF1294 domain-containing protein [Clostridia bacterium]|nr:DUF1294 domain-containing protein [Clostridia bacterium]